MGRTPGLRQCHRVGSHELTLCHQPPRTAAIRLTTSTNFQNSLLELAIHWLAPSRVGTTIVIHHGELDLSALDTSTAVHTPPLSVANRRHFAALVAVLRQHDLAVVVTPEGAIRKVAVGLRWSEDAERAVTIDRGMRHRSAQRYSWDQPSATVVVVSEDGPVTVFRRGEIVVTTGAAPAPLPTAWPVGAL